MNTEMHYQRDFEKPRFCESAHGRRVFRRPSTNNKTVFTEKEILDSEIVIVGKKKVEREGRRGAGIGSFCSQKADRFVVIGVMGTELEFWRMSGDWSKRSSGP